MKNCINKVAYLISKNKTNITLLVILSAIYYIFLYKLAIPYGEKVNILTDENTPPSQAHMLEYILLTYPTYLIYVLISFVICLKLSFIRTPIYPLISLFYVFSSTYCIMSRGVEYIWLYVLAYPIWISIFAIMIIIGVILDIKTFKNTIVPDDYNIYQKLSATGSIWKSRFLEVIGFIKNICTKIWNYFTEGIEE